VTARQMVEEAAGNLSAEERARACMAANDPARSIESAQAHYAEVLGMAKTAARELKDRLATEGVPGRKPVPGYPNAFDAMPAVMLMQVCRLINTFAWSNTRLWTAAQMVCDMRA
jgi:hypothetical protein